MAEPVSSKTTTATVRGLLPNWSYAAAVSANGGANWSPWLDFTTSSDTTAPGTVTNLTVTVQGASFLLNWDVPTVNEDGSELNDFHDFIVRVYPTATPTTFVEEMTTSSSYEFNIEKNRFFFGTAQNALTFEVYSRDLTMNRSAPATVSATAAAPIPFTAYIATGPRALEIYWDNQAVTTYYKVYRSQTSGFAPNDDTNLLSPVVTEVGEGIRVSYWDIPPDTATYYYKVIAIDAYGNSASSNELSGAAAEAGGGLDTTALNTPAAPTLAGGTHSVTVQHNMLDTAGVRLGSNLVRFDVHISTTTGFTPGDTTFVGSIAVGSGTVAEETFVWVVKSTTTAEGTTVSGTDTIYVKVIAVNIAGGASAASAEASTTVSGAGSPYFKSLAIGDGHIANLSANKLKANTAIVNTLNVTAKLKMGVGGVIESGNYAVDATTGVQTGGWRLTDTQFSIVGAARINGTIEATAGWLQNLRVYGSIIVGSSTTTGTIHSYNYAQYVDEANPGAGWKINSDGSAALNSASFRGTVRALDGLLKNLTIQGTLSIASGGKISVNADRVRIDQYGITAFDGSKNTFRIDQNGVATFAGGLSAATGTFAGNLSAAGGNFRGIVEASEYRSVGASYSLYIYNNEMRFKYGTGDKGRIYWGSTGGIYFDAFFGQAASAYVRGDNVILQSSQGLLLESQGNASCTFKVGTGNYTSLKHTYSTDGVTANNATATIMTSTNYSLWAAWKDHGHGEYAASSHGTHVVYGAEPRMVSSTSSGTAGGSSYVSRADHGHDLSSTHTHGNGTRVGGWLMNSNDATVSLNGSTTGGAAVHNKYDGSRWILFKYTSTRKLKSNIVDYLPDTAGNFIKTLRPRTWLDDSGGPGAGFVAEEVPPDTQVLGPDGPEFYDQYRILAAAVSTIQNLMDRIDVLEQRLGPTA